MGVKLKIISIQTEDSITVCAQLSDEMHYVSIIVM